MWSLAEASSSSRLGDAGLRRSLGALPLCPLRGWEGWVGAALGCGPEELPRAAGRGSVPWQERGWASLGCKAEALGWFLSVGLVSERRGKKRGKSGALSGGWAAPAGADMLGGMGIRHHCFAPLPRTVRERCRFCFISESGLTRHLLTGILFWNQLRCCSSRPSLPGPLHPQRLPDPAHRSHL